MRFGDIFGFDLGVTMGDLRLMALAPADVPPGRYLRNDDVWEMLVLSDIAGGLTVGTIADCSASMAGLTLIEPAEGFA